MADWYGEPFRRALMSAERFKDRAISDGSSQVNTEGSRSSALLSRVTTCDQRFGWLLPPPFSDLARERRRRFAEEARISGSAAFWRIQSCRHAGLSEARSGLTNAVAAPYVAHRRAAAQLRTAARENARQEAPIREASEREGRKASRRQSVAAEMRRDHRRRLCQEHEPPGRSTDVDASKRPEPGERGPTT
jgi:hypothetical protein